MSKHLRLLIVEDCENDAELMRLNLQRQGFQCECRRASTAERLEAALHEPWDLAIVDYFLPGLEVSEVLRIVKERAPDIPVIVMSGQTREDRAVAVMKAGADDYISKGNLLGLAAAVERELEQARLRRERKQAEEALRRTNEQYRLLFEGNPHPMWVVDPETLAFLAVNDAATRHYGYSREEFKRMNLREIRPAEDVPALVEFHQRTAEQNSSMPTAAVWRHRKRDGSLIYAEVTANPVQFEGRSALLVLAHDITEQQRAATALRNAEAHFRSLIENASDLITIVDRHGIVLYESPAIERLLGYKPEELVGTSGFEAMYPADMALAKERLAVLLRRAEPFGTGLEFRLRHKNGSWRVFESIGKRITDPVSGHPVAVLNLRDVTDRKAVAEQLRQNWARLQELSRQLLNVREEERLHLARELHDEIGQNLTAVKLSLQSMLQYPDPAAMPNDLRTNIDIVDRVINQVRALLSDLRPALLPELGAVVALREHLARQAQRTGLLIEFSADPCIGRLEETLELVCFRVAQEAVFNIVRHAQATKISVTLNLLDQTLLLTIADNGVGFDPALISMPDKRGWHFGWTGMQERVALVGGTIEWNSTPQGGTRIQALFPIPKGNRQAEN